MSAGTTDRIREYARREYIEPARKRGEITVRIVAGEVHKALRLQNRSPQVCTALRSPKFLEENRLALEKAEGPPSGMSTTMKFTYRMLDVNPAAKSESDDPLMRLWGIGREVFQSLGGGEAFIRSQRDHFYDSEEDS